MAERLTIDELHRILSDGEAVRGDAFNVARSLAGHVNAFLNGAEVPAQDLVLRALEHRLCFGASIPILDGAVRELGLFPYLDPEELASRDLLAYEFHRPLNMESQNIVFHRVQAQVYRELMAGRSVVLSAPTSFGKSLIIDAMVASGNFNNIVVVVPTIALIDETRRRLAKFRSRYRVLTHSLQEPGERNIFVLTQERVIDHPNLEKVDFFVVDEFYKLQPGTQDERSLTLNHAFYLLLKKTEHFYLLGPSIDQVAPALIKRYECTFIKTDYATVASEVKKVPHKGEGYDELAELCQSLKDPTLVFCSSPDRCHSVAKHLLELGVARNTSRTVQSAVEWVRGNYHPDWTVAAALEAGIGVHHARIPRALGQFVVRAFNQGMLKFLVCTSTLIEGVNTKAKNVVVFDNKISRAPIDFFTFNNIKGRSGRMFQHFVGNVFLFHDPPQPELPLVDVPIVSQSKEAPASLLLQVDDDDLTPESRARIAKYLVQDTLSPEILRSNSGLDPDAQITLAQKIRENTQAYWHQLSWTKFPTYQQLVFACELIWSDLATPGQKRGQGVKSGRQLAFLVNALGRRGPRGLLLEQIKKLGDGDIDKTIDEVQKFLRSWATFTFPRLLTALNRIQHDVFTRAQIPAGNYDVFIGRVESMFMDPAILALDEYGIPPQLGAKLAGRLNPKGELDVALERLRNLNVSSLGLGEFERELIESAKSGL